MGRWRKGGRVRSKTLISSAWVQMACRKPGCDEKTIAFDCIWSKCKVHSSNSLADCFSGRTCYYSQRTILDLNSSVFLHHCYHHNPNFKSKIFQILSGDRSRDVKDPSHIQSEDFKLKDVGKSMMVISGRDFDDMARKHSYSAEIKEYLRGVIQRYLNFPGVESKRKAGEDHATHLHSRNANESALGAYRDHFAKGWVYIVQYRNQGVSDSKKLSLKIGYSSNVENRVSNYRCKNMYRDILARVPSSSNKEQNPAPALWGVYLLEQILHAVYVKKQENHDCYCGVNDKLVRHGEVFDFEPVSGIDDERKAGQTRVKYLEVEMNDWARIIRKAEGALKQYTISTVCDIHK
ncbi:MAG: hypothetical protein J3R72DRAFT_179741 [Linnemannia gamsii]|nr:MAG: hypothetical protein J3R72DRAFT_179741 [Linnemannia gamsii]